MWRRVSYVLVGLSLTACAAATQHRRLVFGGASRDVITAAEIVAARVTDAYQAVIQLRPEFLRRRAGSEMPFSLAPIEIYVDGLPLGHVEALRLVPLERVRLIRYMNPVEADLRFGGKHGAGAILVTTLK